MYICIGRSTYMYACTYVRIYMIPARGPKQCFKFLFVVPPLLCNLCHAIFAVLSLQCSLCSGPSRNHFLTGARFTCTCYRNRNLAFQCSRAPELPEPTSSLPLPTSKSLEFIALSLLGLSRAHLANQQIVGFHCSGLSGLTAGF